MKKSSKVVWIAAILLVTITLTGCVGMISSLIAGSPKGRTYVCSVSHSPSGEKCRLAFGNDNTVTWTNSESSYLPIVKYGTYKVNKTEATLKFDGKSYEVSASVQWHNFDFNGEYFYEP